MGDVIIKKSSGGIPGGSNTQVQYNNNGAFGGITNATTDGTTLTLTSPKIVTQINDTNGNTLLGITATASAAESLTIANAASGGNPTLSAVGGDTNISIGITPKGTGGAVITSTNIGPSTITRGLTVNNASNALSTDGFIAKGAGSTLIQTDPSTDTVSKMGKITNYAGVATNGLGIPAIYKIGRATAQTAVNASVATYTVGSSDGSFIISTNVLVTTSTTHTFTVTCSYTDEGNTSRTVTFNVQQLGGTLVTSITNVTGAGPYEGVPLHIRCKASTSITIGTTGTFTTVTYNVEGSIIQIA